MLSLSASEIRIIRVWSEKGESSPFSQERALYTKIKNNVSESILHWAELETRGHHGTDQYLLELEELLINKIESYLNERGEKFFTPL